MNELALLPEVFESPISNTSYNNKMSEIKDQFIQEQKALNNKRRRLIREVNEFPESDVDIGRVPVVERDLQEIKI